jgi:hypothetical protein
VEVRLPGQEASISPELEELLRQSEAECKRTIEFSGVPREHFIGRTEWRNTDILVEIQRDLTAPMAEYVAAHELCHVLQLARCCAIASGRRDEPGAVTIATQITDLVLDPLADSMAVGYGIAMAPGFEAWLESERLMDSLKRPRNGRRYGTNWQKIWEALTEARVCQTLGLQPPKPTRDFWTLHVALDLGRVALRASNLGLSTGVEVLESIKKIALLSKVATDLMEIGAASDIGESAPKLVAILDYFEAHPGHILVNRPSTSEYLIEGQWQAGLSQSDEEKDEINHE